MNGSLYTDHFQRKLHRQRCARNATNHTRTHGTFLNAWPQKDGNCSTNFTTTCRHYTQHTKSICICSSYCGKDCCLSVWTQTLATNFRITPCSTAHYLSDNTKLAGNSFTMAVSQYHGRTTSIQQPMGKQAAQFSTLVQLKEFGNIFFQYGPLKTTHYIPPHHPTS